MIRDVGIGVKDQLIQPADRHCARQAGVLNLWCCPVALPPERAFLCKVMRTLSWNPDGPSLDMIDQRRLPAEFEVLRLRSAAEVAGAIADMSVRGAPAIGIAAAFGIALAACASTAANPSALRQELAAAAEALRGSRPTAVNLAWAVERQLQLAARSQGEVALIADELVRMAQRMADEDVDTNRRIGQHGAGLLHDGDTVLHHCNTGALATVDYGTALGVVRCAHEQGKRIHVLVDETRPRLQGARLTAWELEQLGIPYEIITDGAAGFYLHRGEVAAALVGADRVAANGDVANKIGTYMLALAASDNDVPFYCALPLSTVDPALAHGGLIPIEERDPQEVLGLERDGRPVAPPGSRARNPAFDLTPARLISAFITEAGVIRPPYVQTLATALEEASSRWASS